MISEYFVVRIAKNDIAFVRLLVEKKLEFYVKLRNFGLTKNKFFRLCFAAIMDDNEHMLRLLNDKHYSSLIKEEYKIRSALDNKIKSLEAGNEKRRFLKRLKEYDITYYFKEEDYIDYGEM
jgi:hypothetical protein